MESTSPTNHGVSLPLLKVANVLAFVGTIAVNFLSTRGSLGGKSLGEITDLYGVKINPAGGAFGIWPVIYILNGAFLCYQFSWPKEDEALLLHGVGFWYIGACAFNAAWISIFIKATTEALWISTFVIGAIPFCLCKIYVNTDCWSSPRAGGVMQRIVLDVHVSMYASWVTVAAVVNLSMSIAKVWSPSASTASALAFVVLVVVLAVKLYITVSRRDPVWGGVYAWASFWIFIGQTGEDNVVVAGALIAFIVSGLVSMFVAGREMSKASPAPNQFSSPLQDNEKLYAGPIIAHSSRV
jgi:hypothetical protein